MFNLVNSKLIMQIEKYWGMRELAEEGEVYDIVTSLNLIKLQHWAVLNYANGKLYIQLSSTWKHQDIEGSFSYSEDTVYIYISKKSFFPPNS